MVTKSGGIYMRSDLRAENIGMPACTGICRGEIHPVANVLTWKKYLYLVLVTSVTSPPFVNFLIIFSSFVSTAAHEWERFSIKSGTNGLGVYKSPGPFIGTVAREQQSGCYPSHSFISGLCFPLLHTYWFWPLSWLYKAIKYTVLLLTAPGCAYILDHFPRIISHDLGILFMLKEVDYGSDYCPRQRVLLRKRKYTKVYVKGNRIRFGLLSSSMSCNRTELLKVYVKGDRIRFKLLFCPHRRVFFM